MVWLTGPPTTREIVPNPRLRPHSKVQLKLHRFSFRCIFFYKSQLTRKPSSITVPWWMQPPYKAFQASACRHHCNPSHHRQVKHHPSNAERLSIIHLFKPSYYKCWGGGGTNTNIISASIWCKISYGCFWLRLAALETLISHYTAGADARTPGSFGWSPKTSTKT